jgi:hypothetical protein
MFPVFGVACFAHELAAGRAYDQSQASEALRWIVG